MYACAADANKSSLLNQTRSFRVCNRNTSNAKSETAGFRKMVNEEISAHVWSETCIFKFRIKEGIWQPGLTTHRWHKAFLVRQGRGTDEGERYVLLRAQGCIAGSKVVLLRLRPVPRVFFTKANSWAQDFLTKCLLQVLPRTELGYRWYTCEKLMSCFNFKNSPQKSSFWQAEIAHTERH